MQTKVAILCEIQKGMSWLINTMGCARLTRGVWVVAVLHHLVHFAVGSGNTCTPIWDVQQLRSLHRLLSRRQVEDLVV